MSTAITHLSLETMEAMTSNRDFIAPFSYKDLWLYAKKGDRIVITDDPKKVEQMFPNLDWFQIALPQILLQHKLGCLNETVANHLTYYAP